MRRRIEDEIKKQLLNLKDDSNKAFVAKLLPNIDKERILGIKTPILKQFSKELSKDKTNYEFLEILPHYYIEEYFVHCFLIETIKDFELCIKETEKVLPYIDNWANCDQFNPKIFKKYPNETLKYIYKRIKSDETYTIRFWIWLLLSNYLDNEFKKDMLDIVAKIKTEEYYIEMMQARYFATALAKQPTPTLVLIKKKTLSKFVQNKTIQKARESRRISEELKTELLNYKII